MHIKQTYNLDFYSLLLYILVSLSFPATYKAIIPAIIALTGFQVYRLINKRITTIYFLNTYFYLLVFSLLFFRSVHTLILIINLCFHFYLFLKNRPRDKGKTIISEVYVLIFFGLILVNYSIHTPYLKGIETYLYLLLYPLLFICIKRQPIFIQISKAINVYVASVVIATFYLLIVNIIFHKLTFSTNTFFSEYLGIIHVYFGMFIGLALCFMLALITKQKTYITKTADYFLIIFLLLFLIYIGARIALLGIILIVIVTIYRRVQLKWYKKSTVIAIVIIGMFVLSYHSVPRVKRGLDSIEKIYSSVKTNNKEDLVHNSWKNMYKRFLVTKYTLKEIKGNYLIGIGNKNIKEVISNKIISDGYIYFEPINTHNQYLHFLIGMGLPSFLFFIWLLFHYYKNYSYTSYSLYFILFFLLIMLTESLLVRVKGISLFFLFFLIFSLQDKKQFHE